MQPLVKLTRKYLGRLWSEDETGTVFTREIEGHGIIKMYEVLGIRVLDLRETKPPLGSKQRNRIASSFLKRGLIVTPLDGGGCEVHNHRCWSAVKFKQCRGKRYLRHGRNPSALCLRLRVGAPLEDMVRDALAVREDKPIDANALQLLDAVES